MSAAVTILIAARNAEVTIERALRSCLPETGSPIVLVDDHSTDRTVARARATAGSRLLVVSAPDPGGVAMARQAALDATTTEYAAWLDADDEWVPGRAQRLRAMLASGADIASEAIDLFDGISGTWLRTLTVPPFVRAPGGAVRLFERNFLPGDTQVAFRVRTFREAGGYDAAITGPESFDVLLRALRVGATMAFGDEAGYRMHAYPDSVSRDLGRQRAALAHVLRKHEYSDVWQLYRAGGFDRRVAAWALVMMAQFRGDTAIGLRFLDQASPEGANPREVLEPDGPWPQPEGWRRAFQRGTLLLGMEGADEEAAVELSRAEAFEPTPEGANNLGVALARLGRPDEAARAFEMAEQRRPGYQDACVNAVSDRPAHITTHPLRRTPSRSEYPVPRLVSR